MPATAAELARHLNAELRGDPARVVRAVASLATAGADELSFVADESYLDVLERSGAGTVLVRPAHADRCRGTALLVDNPHAAFARAAALLHPPAVAARGIHPSATVAPGARVDASASIGAGCVIEADVVIGERCVIGPLCHIEAGALLGADTRLVSGVFVGARCVIGRGCLAHPGAVIGADGFGYARDGERWIKVPQLGRVVIGDDVEIGANTTVDRGALDDTVIGNGVKLDNLIQIAHNVRIGDHTAMAGLSGVAGSAVIGRRCTIGGQAGINGHIEVCDDVHVTATTLVTKSIHEPGAYASNLKAEPLSEWRRIVVRLGQLDKSARRLRELEDRFNRLQGERKT